MFMMQEPLTLYKLLILYILNRVDFPLMKTQIMDFLLERDYANSLTLQQAFSELAEMNMVETQTIQHRTQFSITEEGRMTLDFFKNQVSCEIRNEIDDYLRENKWMLRNEFSILSDYSKTVTGEYEAKLVAKEKDTNLLQIILTVPSELAAADVCDNWQQKNQEIYQYLIKQLFS